MTDPTRTAFEKWFMGEGFQFPPKPHTANQRLFDDMGSAFYAGVAHRDSHMPSVEEIALAMLNDQRERRGKPTVAAFDGFDDETRDFWLSAATAVKRLMEGK